MSPECSSCHEAGHAAAWTVNGYNVLLVVAYKSALALMSPEQNQLVEGAMGSDLTDPAVMNNCTRMIRSGGMTMVSAAGPDCQQCGRTFKSRQFDDECDGCVKLLTDHIASMFAGGAATSRFLPNEHRVSQSNDDHGRIDSILVGVQDGQKRQSVRGRAEAQAQDFIRRRSKEVGALCGVLIERGVLEGSEIEKIMTGQIQANIG
jgi:hypothetical protein